MWILSLLGCGPQLINMQATVFEGYGSSVPLHGGSITVIDTDAELVTEQDLTAGRFEIDVPRNSTLHIVLEADDFVTTTFTGFTTAEDMVIDDGQFFVHRPQDLQDLHDTFMGCPGAGDLSKNVVFGEIRAINLSDPEDGTPLAISTGNVIIEDLQGNTVSSACFYDEGGEYYEPAAERTGPSGKFVVFGLGEGAHLVKLGYEYLPDQWTFEFIWVWIPEGGAIAPLLPGYVSVPS